MQMTEQYVMDCIGEMALDGIDPNEAKQMLETLNPIIYKLIALEEEDLPLRNYVYGALMLVDNLYNNHSYSHYINVCTIVHQDLSIAIPIIAESNYSDMKEEVCGYL